MIGQDKLSVKIFYPRPILKMAVLHEGHVPLIAGLPFFMVYGDGLPISRLSLHFTQYPIVIPNIDSMFYYPDLVELFLLLGKLTIYTF